jgi:cell wall-associated NlpC family hydrolase
MQQTCTSARPSRAFPALAAACALIAAPVPATAAASPAATSAPDASPAVVLAEVQQALGIPPAGRLTLRPAGTPEPGSDAGRAHALLSRVRAAGDRIARRPYVYGGGHGSFDSAGYDCSGSVSYVLHAGGLLDTPLASGPLTTYGRPGKGRHVTIYANAGHVFMTIDGRRFDTIAFQESGSRWSDTVASADGYVVRHPPGM